jgi:hypothetical protein
MRHLSDAQAERSSWWSAGNVFLLASIRGVRGLELLELLSERVAAAQELMLRLDEPGSKVEYRGIF